VIKSLCFDDLEELGTMVMSFLIPADQWIDQIETWTSLLKEVDTENWDDDSRENVRNRLVKLKEQVNSLGNQCADELFVTCYSVDNDRYDYGVIYLGWKSTLQTLELEKSLQSLRLRGSQANISTMSEYKFLSREFEEIAKAKFNHVVIRKIQPASAAQILKAYHTQWKDRAFYWNVEEWTREWLYLFEHGDCSDDMKHRLVWQLENDGQELAL